MTALAGHNYRTPPLPAVGRFYKQGRGWCSGTMLYAGVILTAGHCVHGTESRQGYYPAGDFTFTPGNTWDGTKGVGSYGNWRVTHTYTTNSYAQNGAAGLDWGIAVVAPDASGKFPGDYTGTFPSYGNVGGLTANQTTVTRMGYPASGPWQDVRYQLGNGQYYCTETISSMDQSTIGVWWLRYDNACPMNGGSSGGPNFIQFSNGVWGIIGVNNRGCGPCNVAYELMGTGFGERSSQNWFDQNYVDFVNSVLAILNGNARQADSPSPGTAVSAESLRRKRPLSTRAVGVGIVERDEYPLRPAQ